MWCFLENVFLENLFLEKVVLYAAARSCDVFLENGVFSLIDACFDTKTVTAL